MLPSLLVRFRPAGPWRLGPDSGARDRVDTICHSDTLYSAVTAAMARLGHIDEWLAATTAGPVVRLGSLFPYLGEILFVTPPRSLWPPSTSSRVRWASAQFVPLSVVESLLAGKTLDEDNWIVDGASGCLVPAGGRFRGTGPFRVAMHTAAAIDRLGEGVESHATACIEFADEAGMWGLVAFSSDEVREQWGHKLRSALRLLADSGIGGERSRGWGRSAMPSIREGTATALLFRNRRNGEETELAPESENAHWLLSLFNPAAEDAVDWRAGNYQIVSRVGRIESPVSSGGLKKEVRMVAEGSILVSPVPLGGAVRDVAPDGFPHPVYRAGYAVSIPIRWGKPAPAPAPPPPPPVEDLPAEEPQVDEGAAPTETAPVVEPALEPHTGGPDVSEPEPETFVELAAEPPAVEAPAPEPNGVGPDVSEPEPETFVEPAAEPPGVEPPAPEPPTEPAIEPPPNEEAPK